MVLNKFKQRYLDSIHYTTLNYRILFPNMAIKMAKTTLKLNPRIFYWTIFLQYKSYSRAAWISFQTWLRLWEASIVETNVHWSVVINDWESLSIESWESSLQRSFVVIFSLDQWFSSDVINSGDLWWMELNVIRSSWGLVNSSSANSFNKERVVDLHVDNVSDLLSVLSKDLVEFFSLDEGSWETVKDHTSETTGSNKISYVNTKMGSLGLF